MNTTNTDNALKGGFDLMIEGDQTINGQVTIDLDAKLQNLLKKEGTMKLILTFENFVTSGTCSISFGGKAKGSKKVKSKNTVEVAGGPATA